MTAFNLTETYLPTSATARRYGVTDRSIARWQADPATGFPAPLIVNKRKFFAVTDLDAWERSKGVTRKAA